VAVSPADGKVVAIRPTPSCQNRISIFLNIFDVHVNRTPIAGKVACITYKKGEFLVASKPDASSANEQNVITVDGVVGGRPTRVVFSQIAGLIARRIICYKKPGDILGPAERVGLIKFGSRVDVILGPEWEVTVPVGVHVSAGSSVIARMKEVV
jgi:phosphatidylserine decarboxylase